MCKKRKEKEGAERLLKTDRQTQRERKRGGGGRDFPCCDFRSTKITEDTLHVNEMHGKMCHSSKVFACGKNHRKCQKKQLLCSVIKGPKTSECMLHAPQAIHVLGAVDLHSDICSANASYIYCLSHSCKGNNSEDCFADDIEKFEFFLRIPRSFIIFHSDAFSDSL